jgi:hypothetical protein
MDYAIMFSLMGVTILFLLYRNYKLNRFLMITERVITALIEGEVEVKKTGHGFEVTMKKEV